YNQKDSSGKNIGAVFEIKIPKKEVRLLNV
ncbi:MAG: hypothetical protein QG567_2050, partial [Campylobacterota bacterium]|nr:hypothetical protein [Campylobacterota bacterium]